MSVSKTVTSPAPACNNMRFMSSSRASRPSSASGPNWAAPSRASSPRKGSFEGVLSLGVVEVLVYNACQAIPDHPTRFVDVTLESFEKTFAVSSVGAFQCAQQVIPGMTDRGRGTILFTGTSASLTGFPGYCGLGCGKFALQALSQCLAKELQPSGMHVAHIVIDGPIGSPG